MRRTLHWTSLAACVLAGATSILSAQDPRGARRPTAPCTVIDGVRQPDCDRGPGPGAGTPGMDQDPLARHLFPPDLVMAHQRAINLTDKQRLDLQTAMLDAQKAMLDAQFKMTSAMETLERLVQNPSVDESKTLEQVDRVLNIERDLKHVQMTLMIRVKNLLTEQQQAQLNQLRGRNARGDDSSF